MTLESRSKNHSRHSLSGFADSEGNNAAKHPSKKYKMSTYDEVNQTVRLTSGQRETWDKKIEFLLAVIGFAVDLGNVWRFPYICYRNGGGAFLVPYAIMLVLGGLPLFYMELALGQYYKCGCLTLWRYICPALKGVGYAICLLDMYVGMHYNTIIGWAVFYLVETFREELPWQSCENDWNTPNCTLIGDMANASNPESTTSPAKEYFDRKVLELQNSDGLDRVGHVKWSLALCVFSVLFVVYFSLWKGVRSTGKVIWITALAPYVVLFILLGRGITLPGSDAGIRYYLTPQWDKLTTGKVWVDAATQIFFSLGPGFGTLFALSSYNKFHNNCYKDAIVTSTINCLTSFLAGFVIFSVLGYMAKMQNKEIYNLGLEGPGLVFVVYPEAISMMPGSKFWSAIFFLMLITLGLDSTFGGLEAIITALCDEYPLLLCNNRELFVAVLVFIVFVLSLPTCTYGGVYLVTLLNTYGPGISVLFIVFVEASAVCWFYGVDKFSRDVERMIGQLPSLFWRTTWNFITPTFIIGIFMYSIYDYEDLSKMENYTYPKWSILVGWILTLSSVSCIPIYVIIQFISSSGTVRERIKKITQPTDHVDTSSLTPPPTYGTNV